MMGMDSSNGQKLPPYFFFITMARRLRDAGVRIDTDVVQDENSSTKAPEIVVEDKVESEERISADLDFLTRLEARNQTLKNTLY